MSALGIFRTWRDVRVESVMRFKADIGESNNSELDDVSVSLRPI